MKHILVLFLTLVLASPVLAQVEKKAKVSNHETDKQAEDNATRQNLRDRLDALEAALKSVQWEPHKSPGLDAPERKTEQEWEKWMLDTRQELKTYVRNLDKILKRKVLDPEAVRENNMQFQALQNAVDNESQKFNTLSNASKSRHETAKNAIGNIR
jgi:hypothetical protein